MGKMDWRKYLELIEEENKIKRDIQTARMRVQDNDIAMYLNGLFRQPDSKPLIYDNAVPEIYILHHDTTITLAWYLEREDIYVDRQETVNGKYARKKFDKETILGWCYKSELFPDLSKI